MPRSEMVLEPLPLESYLQMPENVRTPEMENE